MFTGIIEETAPITKKSLAQITVSRPKSFDVLTKGQSIAVNGACLSVVDFSDTDMMFDVLSETFRRTNLADSSQVNLERAMPAHGRFEGHIVLGHVDGKAALLSREKEDSGEKFVFQLNAESEHLESLLLEKGSIAINGISLTLGKISGDEGVEFEIFCIPITLAETNLGNLKRGEKVTIEGDYLAKIVQKGQKNKGE